MLIRHKCWSFFTSRSDVSAGRAFLMSRSDVSVGWAIMMSRLDINVEEELHGG